MGVAEVAAGTALATAAVLKASQEIALNNGPNYIANGQPTSTFGQAGLQVARFVCRQYAANPSRFDAAAGRQYEVGCRQYLAANGWGTGDAGDSFTGAQCVGVGYNFYPEQLNPTTGIWSERAPLVIYGPVTGRSITFDAGAVRTFWNVTGRSSSGTPLTSTTNNGINRREARWGRITRLDGSTVIDNCGSLPVVITDPQPGPNPGTRVILNISPTFQFDASVNVQNSGNVSIKIGDTEVNFDPFADEASGGGGGSTLPPGDVGLPGLPVGTGSGGEVAGAAPEGQVLVGLRVNVLVVPKRANIYAPGIYRGACYIYMGTTSGLDHDPAGSMLRDNQFIFAEKDNLNRWAVRANLGYSLSVTPYYRTPTP